MGGKPADGRNSTEVARHCAAQGRFASNGFLSALTVAGRLGHDANGLARLSLAAYTPDEEVERVITAVARIVR